MIDFLLKEIEGVFNNENSNFVNKSGMLALVPFSKWEKKAIWVF